MSFPSPSAASSRFNDMVGDLVVMPSTLGTYLQKPDGREYVRTGSARAVTAAYREAANHPVTKVVGLASSNFATVVAGTVRDVAFGAAGQIAIVTSDSTNYFYSTDYGNTWTATAHGFVSFPPCTIAYDATVGGWVIAGATPGSGNMEIRTTPALGTALTLRVQVAGTFSSVAEQVAVRSTGGRFVLVATSGTLSYYCTTLAVWTAATTGYNGGAYAVRMIVGSGRVIAFNSNNGTYYSNDGGVNWTGGTPTPAACSNGVYNQADGNYYFQQGTSGTIYKSATGYSGFTTMAFPDNGVATYRLSGLNPCMASLNGEVLFTLLNGNVAKTKDFIEYTVIQTANATNGFSFLAVDSNYNFLQVTNSAVVAVYGNLNVCTYVGHLTVTRSDDTASANVFTAYARIR